VIVFAEQCGRFFAIVAGHLVLSDPVVDKAEHPETVATNIPYWGYEDIGFFVTLIALFGVLLRLFVSVHFLPRSYLANPTMEFQAVLLVALLSSLYLILRLRYHRPVFHALGWFLPSRSHFTVALVLGPGFAASVTLFAHRWKTPASTSPLSGSLADLLVLGVLLGPVLEETFFRGCLLPVLVRTMQPAFAIFLAAVLFALLHRPDTASQWFWFTLTGVAYGWARIASESTVAAAVMHASYNLSILLAHFFHC
jgi:membrane protease YdiL (CAAX protease family)